MSAAWFNSNEKNWIIDFQYLRRWNLCLIWLVAVPVNFSNRFSCDFLIIGFSCDLFLVSRRFRLTAISVTVIDLLQSKAMLQRFESYFQIIALNDRVKFLSPQFCLFSCKMDCVMRLEGRGKYTRAWRMLFFFFFLRISSNDQISMRVRLHNGFLFKAMFWVYFPESWVLGIFFLGYMRVRLVFYVLIVFWVEVCSLLVSSCAIVEGLHLDFVLISYSVLTLYIPVVVLTGFQFWPYISLWCYLIVYDCEV